MKKLLILSLWGVFCLTAVLRADENYLTVYNQNLALVKQVRTLLVTDPNKPIRFSEVAANIIPTSVHLRPLAGTAFQVLEQNYEYDLISAEKILSKYVDHRIQVVTEDGEVVSGILLSRSSGSLVLKTAGGIKILPWNDKTSVEVKDLPEGLITRPTLVWEVAGLKKGKQKLEVSYLTRGMEWHAEYVGVLNEQQDRIALSAWVSVKNNSGATFRDAHLKLVAGEIHRAEERRRIYPMAKAEARAYAPEAAFQERAFFEYHIYELERPTTLKNNQIKQITLFPDARIRCQKELVYDASRDAKRVEVQVFFKNSKDAGLGRPLPAGIFRIYQRDRKSLEFVGEDRIEHIPRNEEVRLTVGKAFDLVGERKIADRQKISKRSERQTIEIELRNNKEKEDVTITVRERMPGRYWTIENSNFPYRKVNAAVVEFKIPVKANGKTTLKYTVTYRW